MAYASLSLNTGPCYIHPDSKTLVILPTHLLGSRDPGIHPASANTARPLPRLLPTPRHPSMARLPRRRLQRIRRVDRRTLGGGPRRRWTRMGRRRGGGGGGACGCAHEDGE